MAEKVRIKKGVKPYGGRLLTVASREVLATGRKIVVVYAPTWNKGLSDQRVYNEDEVEEQTR
jgi:hypothetical protein